MASIYQNANGTFTVRWMAGRDRTGRKVRDSRTFESEQAAAHKHAIEQHTTGAGKDGLEARALEWIESRQALGKIGKKTAVGYAEKIRGWSRLIGPKPFKKIIAGDIDRAFARLAVGETPTGRKPSARTLHHYRTALATFFNAMEAKSEISANPMRGVESIGGLDQRTRRAPIADELRRMLAAAGESPMVFGQLQPIIRLSAHLGLRRGEVCALRWADLDFLAMTVSVKRAATQPTGREVFFKSPKSAAGFRTIAMRAPTAALLREHRKVVAAWRLAAGPGWADNDLVFCDPLGQVLDLEDVSRAAGIVRDRAGVPRAVLPLHGQRHYALTELHRAGVDVLTMQARAGHADIRSTQAYITVDADKDREAAEKAVASLL